MINTQKLCNWEGCNEVCASGNSPKHGPWQSKYCWEHKKLAKKAWKEKIEAEKEERVSRENRFGQIIGAALARAHNDGEAHSPTPMIVEQHQDMLDDSSPVKKSWFVEQGVCGFVWVNLKPATSSFCRFLQKKAPGWKRDSYYGGLTYWVFQFGQSYEKKVAFARELAKALNEHQEETKTHAVSMNRLD